MRDETCVEGGNPFGLDGLHADFTSVCLDVGVVNLSQELDFWRFEGVVVAKVYVYDKSAANKGRALWPLNDQLPHKQIVTDFNSNTL